LAYCLMPNHVHLILCPRTKVAWRRRRRPVRRIGGGPILSTPEVAGGVTFLTVASPRLPWTSATCLPRSATLLSIRSGHGWWPPLRIWPWSSVRAHLSGEDDGLVMVRPVLDRIDRFGGLMSRCRGGRLRDAVRRGGHRPPAGDRRFRRRPGARAWPAHRGASTGKKPAKQIEERPRLQRGMLLLSPNSPRTAGPSLDRWRAGRGAGDPRLRPLDHQSVRHDRRPSVQLADAVLPLRCECHVDQSSRWRCWP
jgi:putative transposase